VAARPNSEEGDSLPKVLSSTQPMPQTPPATIKAEVPERLLAQMQVLVEAGWFHDMNDLVIEALRRLVDTHRPDLMEHFVRKDVEWGLGGEE